MGCGAGCDDFVEVELRGEAGPDFLRRFPPFERGIPSHDTLDEVMNGIDVGLFKLCFAERVDMLRDGQPAIDGRTSRRCHDRARGREPLHLVSAWAGRQRLVLGQEETADESDWPAPAPPSTPRGRRPPSPRPSCGGAGTTCRASRTTAAV